MSNTGISFRKHEFLQSRETLTRSGHSINVYYAELSNIVYIVFSYHFLRCVYTSFEFMRIPTSTLGFLLIPKLFCDRFIDSHIGMSLGFCQCYGEGDTYYKIFQHAFSFIKSEVIDSVVWKTLLSYKTCLIHLLFYDLFTQIFAVILLSVFSYNLRLTFEAYLLDAGPATSLYGWTSPDPAGVSRLFSLCQHCFHHLLCLLSFYVCNNI